jgi:hypothetical protein
MFLSCGEEKALFRAGSKYRFQVEEKGHLRWGQSTNFRLGCVLISYLGAARTQRGEYLIARDICAIYLDNKLAQVAVITPIVWAVISAIKMSPVGRGR